MIFEYTLDGRSLMIAIPNHEDRIEWMRMGHTRPLPGDRNPFGFTSPLVHRRAASIIK